MKKSLVILFLTLTTALALSSCAGGSLVGIGGDTTNVGNNVDDRTLSISAAGIKSFEVNGVTGDIDANTITVVLPTGDTDTGAVAPIIELTDPDATIYPASDQIQNFRDHAVLYTVTSKEGAIRYYLATVSNSKNITAFSFPDIEGAVGVIEGLNIYVSVPSDTDKAGLIPEITTSAGATVSPASGIPQNFTYPTNYIVLAADNSVKIYTVTVRGSSKDIDKFVVGGISETSMSPNNLGVINGTNITATVQYGTDLTHLKTYLHMSPRSTLTVKGITYSAYLPSGYACSWGPFNATCGTVGLNMGVDSVNIPGGIDFTHPVDYTITAEDGTSQTYTATVTVRPSYVPGDLLLDGGVIVYTDPADPDAKLLPEGETYLEAAVLSEFEGTGDSMAATTDPVPHGTGTAIGTGQANTAALFAQDPHSIAASCYNPSAPVEINGTSDWFLPSRDELALIRTALYIKDGWDQLWISGVTSSEDQSDLTKVLYVIVDSSGVTVESYSKKTTLHYVCFRAF